MSTNKTTNYQLHKWEPGDDFLRSEFNENFAKIDETLEDKEPAMVFGSYMGDDKASQDIILGFRPKLVMLFSKTGALHSGARSDVNNDQEERGYYLTDQGFQVLFDADKAYQRANFSRESPFIYIAFRNS